MQCAKQRIIKYIGKQDMSNKEKLELFKQLKGFEVKNGKVYMK